MASRRRARLVIGVLVAAVATTMLGSAPASGTVGPVVSGAQLGMSVNGLGAAAPAVVNGASVRLWDTGTRWDQIQPSATAPYNWAPLDAAVAKAYAAGARDILYVLGSTPKWAVPKTDPAAQAKGDLFGPGTSAHPANDAYYLAFLREVIKRYDGKTRIDGVIHPRITSYELWNESNLPTFYRGTPTQLATLAWRAYTVIKAAPAPRPTLTSPSWLLRFWDANRNAQLTAMRARSWPFDVINVHSYPFWQQGPDGRLGYITSFKAKIASLGLRKPIWDTEVNFGNRASGHPARVYSGAVAAQYVARAYIDSLRYGIARTYWYAWDSHVLGIDMIDTTGKRTPAGTAYLVLRSWVVGQHWNGCVTSANGVSRCSLTSSTGARRTLIYTSGASVRTLVPAHATRGYTLDGRSRAIKPGTAFYATASAQLIVGA